MFLTGKGSEPGLQFALAMLAGGMWCITHPYTGMFEHDARVYSLLALHWLSPEAYARDPFFLYGSQDRYSFFTPIYGALATLSGLPNAAMAVTALGGMMWVAGSILVARYLLDQTRLRVFAVLCCAAWSLNYSPNGGTFLLNEAFPTARSIGFPLGVAAVGLAMYGRFWLSVVLAAGSTLLHPLLGIWPLALVLAWRMTDRSILQAVLSFSVLLAVLNLAGLEAFQRIDPVWEAIIRSSSRDVFVGSAGSARINATLGWLSLLLWAGRLSTEPVRRWYQLVALIGAGGFLLAQVTSYFHPLILLVQAQTWRAMWIVVLFGIFAMAQILGVAWRGSRKIWWAIGGLMLMVMSDWAGYILFASFIALHSGSGPFAIALGQKIHLKTGRFAWMLLAGLLVAVFPGFAEDLIILGGGLARDFQTGIPGLDGLLLAGGFGLGFFLLAAVFSFPMPVWVLMSGCVSLLYFAAIHWDQRLDQYRAWENDHQSLPNTSLNGWLRRGDVVLWPGSPPQRVWYELGTASYGSSDQVIGGVFSREKTFELLRRRQRLAIASLADTWPLSAKDERVLLSRYRVLSGQSLDENGNLHESLRSVTLTGNGMLYACEDPALDWVVSTKPLPQDVIDPVPVTHPPAWLYSCAKLRAVSSAPTFSRT